MTISSLIHRNDYVGSGTTGPFAFAFRIFAATDLAVIQRSAAGIETTLTYLVDYTLSTGAVGNRAGGTVTLANALAADGSTLTLLRSMGLLQPTELRNQGPFYAETIEDAFDRLVMIDQGQQDAIDRSLRLPKSYAPGAANEIAPTAGYAIVGTGTGFTSQKLDASATVALPGNGRTTSTLTAYLANNARVNVLDYAPAGVVINTGLNETQTTAAFVAAIAAGASLSRPVYAPAGDYLITGSGTEILLMSGASAGMVGDGMAKTRLLVKSTVGSSTDALRITGSTGTGFRFVDLAIVPQSGTPGRYGINVDVSAAPFSYAVFDHVKVGRLGDYAIKTTNSVAGTGTVTCTGGAAVFSSAQTFPAGSTIVVGTTTYVITAVADTTHATIAGAPTFGASAFTYPNVDGVFTSTIVNCYVDGGIWFDKAGDSLHLKDSTVTGPRGVLIDLVYSGGDGAHGFTLEGGNVTADAGVRVLSGNTTVIRDLNAEQPNTSTSVNAAMIDLDGRQGAPLENVLIDGGFLGGTTGKVNYTVRVNWCKGARIARPTLVSPGVQPTYQGVLVTPNAVGTIIDRPHVAPFGVRLKSVVSDLGTGTQVTEASPSGDNPTVYGAGAANILHHIWQAGAGQTTTPMMEVVAADGTTNVAKVTTSGLVLGAAGTNVSQIRSYAPAVTPSAVGAGLMSPQTVAVSGIKTSDRITLHPPAPANQSTALFAYCAVNDVLTIVFFNPSGGSLTPGAGTYPITAVSP